MGALAMKIELGFLNPLVSDARLRSVVPVAYDQKAPSKSYDHCNVSARPRCGRSLEASALRSHSLDNVHSRPSASRVQQLKRSIEVQIDEIAVMICEGKSVLNRMKSLNVLTSELIGAEIGFCLDHIGLAEGDQKSSEAALSELGQNGVYDPEQLADLGRIFDQAIETLPENMQTPASQTEIAKLMFGRSAVHELELSALILFINAIISVID